MLRYICFISLLSFCSCQFSKQPPLVDYDQLYTLKNEPSVRDSIAQSLQVDIKHALSLPYSGENKKRVDQLIYKLRFTSDSVSFLDLGAKVFEHLQIQQDFYGMAKYYNDKAVYFHENNLLDSVYSNYNKAEEIYVSLEDDQHLGQLYYYKGRLLFEMGLYTESEILLRNAINLVDHPNLFPIKIESYEMLAMVLFAGNQLDRALSYFKKGYDLYQQIDREKYKLPLDKLTMANLVILGNLSMATRNNGMYKESVEYANKALSIFPEDGHPMLLAFIELGKANAEFSLGNREDALRTALNGHKQDVYYNDTYRIISSAFSIGYMYSEMDLKDTAIMWYSKVLELTDQGGMFLLERKNAIDHILMLQDQPVKSLVDQALTLNATLKKQDELHKERYGYISEEFFQISRDHKQLKSAVWVIVLISVFLMIILVLALYNYRLHIRNSNLYYKQKQGQANESIYELIADKKELSAQIKSVERNRIAKDLHDNIVNGIFTIRFNLQLLETSQEKDKQRIVDELKKLEVDSRNLAHSLKNVEQSREDNFLEIITDYLAFQKNQWQTKFSLTIDPNVDFTTFTTEQQIDIFSIIKEACHNVNKYAHASSCEVVFTHLNDTQIMVSIIDNGIGIRKKPNKGIGMSNMKERAKTLGSVLTVVSAKNKGVQLSFVVKLEKDTH